MTTDLHPLPRSAISLSTDILMITYNRPSYTQTTLSALLDTCDKSMRVWLWHNGQNEETLGVTTSFRDHPRVQRFHHSPENVGLTEPTNWLWHESDATYVSKVDDDCIVSNGWVQTLRRAHEDQDRFGVIGSWRFYEEDFIPHLANKKIKSFSGGHRLMLNPWVQGSGYLMKRECVNSMGLLQEGQSFTQWCIDLAVKGWTNGWYYPFIHEEHLDDPRSPYTGLKTDQDLLDRLPLSAKNRGISTLAEWEDQMRRSARRLQQAPVNPRAYSGIRRRARRARQRMQEAFQQKTSS